MTPYTPTQSHALAFEFACEYLKMIGGCFMFSLLATIVLSGVIYAH